MFLRLSARIHPAVPAQRGRSGSEARRLRDHPGDRQRAGGSAVPDSGIGSGLPGMRQLRRYLSCQDEGAHHGTARDADGRSAQLGIRYDAVRQERFDEAHDGQGQSVRAAVLRVLGCVCRLRRDSVRQSRNAAVRRPHDDRQCDRLFFDLRRIGSVDALHEGPQRPRTLLGELPVRGQRRIRIRHGDGRQADEGKDEGYHRRAQRKSRRRRARCGVRRLARPHKRRRKDARSERCAHGGALRCQTDR